MILQWSLAALGGMRAPQKLPEAAFNGVVKGVEKTASSDVTRKQVAFAVVDGILNTLVVQALIGFDKNKMREIEKKHPNFGPLNSALRTASALWLPFDATGNFFQPELSVVPEQERDPTRQCTVLTLNGGS